MPVMEGKKTLNIHVGFVETAPLPFQRSHGKLRSHTDVARNGGRVPTQRDCQGVYPPAAAQIRKIATQQGRINFLPFRDGIIKTTTVGHGNDGGEKKKKKTSADSHVRRKLPCFACGAFHWGLCTPASPSW